MKSRGFSLVDLAMVLFIVALVMGGLLVPITTAIEAQHRAATEQGLEVIKAALTSYAMEYKYFPCPSQISDRSDPGWGKSSGDCSLEGFVPWVDLGLEPIDPWNDETGERWRYRVDPAFGYFEIRDPITHVLKGLREFTLFTMQTGHIVIADYNGTLMTDADPKCFASGGAKVDCFGPHATRIDPNYPIAIIYHTGSDGIADGQNASFEALACGNGTGYDFTFPYRDPTCQGKPLYQAGPAAQSYDDLATWISRPALINQMVKSGILP